MTKIQGMIPGGPSKTHTHPGSGLQVILKPIKGLTHPHLLRAPYAFQVPPLQEFGWDAAANWTDYTTISGGEFSRPGGRALRQIPLSSVVVDWNPSWAVYAGGNKHHPYRQQQMREENVPVHAENNPTEPGGPAPDPRRVAWELDTLCNALSPFRLVVWNKALYDEPDMNLAVTLRSYSVRERAGELDSRYLEMSFTEYRFPTIEERGWGGGGGGVSLPTKVRVGANGVAVEMQGKDEAAHIGSDAHPATLRELAMHYYGESNLWTGLAGANGIKGLGGDDPLTQLDRRGRKYRSLQIPKPDAWRAGGTVAPV